MKNDSFLSRFFPRRDDCMATEEAQFLAGTLRTQPNLCHWLTYEVAPANRDGVAMLTHAAQVLRGEIGDPATAALLQRLADEPALFTAVIRELRAGPVSSGPQVIRPI